MILEADKKCLVIFQGIRNALSRVTHKFNVRILQVSYVFSILEGVVNCGYKYMEN